MKTFKYIIIAAGLFLMSCEEALDIKPTDFISEQAIWEDAGLIKQDLANIYGSIKTPFTSQGDAYGIPAFSHIDLATDDGNGKVDAHIQMFNTGSITAAYTPYAHEAWPLHYGNIRKANNFIEGMDQVLEDVLEQESREILQSEARFIRAFSYFNLVRMFGNVPLIKRAQQIGDEDIFLSESPAEEIYQYIIDECETISEILPLYPESGHVSKGAALALKSRALLYYASPLTNTSNNAERWTDAAEASKELMDLNIYELYTDYRNLFLTAHEGNSEVIWDRQYQFPELPHTSHVTWGLQFTTDAGTWGGFSPTQDLVDAYEMTNGKIITDNESGYDPQNPYANRDSRLDATLIRNGSQWRGMNVEFWQGGNADVNKEVNCGYGLKKFDEEAPMGTNFYVGAYAQENNWIFFRYAEILLNYAEAQNEAIGPDASVYEAINKVRNRAGQPNLDLGLSQDEMRERIINERRVELVYEAHRFYDVRRWKKGSELFNTPIHEVVITKNADGSFTYAYPEKETRVYKEYFNFLPIPLSETEKNPNLTPTPGY